MWLKNNLEQKNDRSVFELVFRSFYGIDNAGLTSEWKAKYFTILYDNIKNKAINVKDVCAELYKIKNNKQQKTIQFSFITKLNNILDPQQPIYDSNVAKVFGFNTLYHIPNFDKRIARHMEQYQIISDQYSKIIASNQNKIKEFKNTFNCSDLHDIKVVDFVVWMNGKKLP